MSQVWPGKYRYQVCPFCESKNIKAVALTKIPNKEYHLSNVETHRTGFLCANCERYHAEDQSKYMTDRAEMNRDIDALLKYLDKGARK